MNNIKSTLLLTMIACGIVDRVEGGIAHIQLSDYQAGNETTVELPVSLIPCPVTEGMQISFTTVPQRHGITIGCMEGDG